jgi:hypothetical protein
MIESSTKESTKIGHPTTFLRAQFLHGACTQQHTDSFRGNQYSYIIAFDEGYELSIVLFQTLEPVWLKSLVFNNIPLS